VTPTQEMQRERAERGMRELHLPVYMRNAVIQYVVFHRLPGEFLQAVLKNDLANAVGRADEANMLMLREWMQLLYNFTPMMCFGSPEKVETWIKEKDKNGG